MISQESTKPSTKGTPLPFHWSYVILPLAILLLSILAVVCFYHLLPAELAYHFKSDGSPDRWVSRALIVFGMLFAQFFFTLLAAILTWGITRLAVLFRQPASTGLKTEKILVLMGNMVAMPQIVLGLAMLDIFSYNSYQIHLLPLWVFALITAGVGSIILGLFFIYAIQQASKVKR